MHLIMFMVHNGVEHNCILGVQQMSLSTSGGRAEQSVDMCEQSVDMCEQSVDMCEQSVDMCEQSVDM